MLSQQSSLRSKLIRQRDIERLAVQFQTLVSAINNPETAIAQLEISPVERQQLLVNNTQTDYPKHQCVHQLFEHQAGRTWSSAVVF